MQNTKKMSKNQRRKANKRNREKVLKTTIPNETKTLYKLNEMGDYIEVLLYGRKIKLYLKEIEIEPYTMATINVRLSGNY